MIEHVLFLQIFFHKSLLTTTCERKLSSVSLPLAAAYKVSIFLAPLVTFALTNEHVFCVY